MWDVHFHPPNLDPLFTSSEDGSLQHRDVSTDVPEKIITLLPRKKKDYFLSHSIISKQAIVYQSLKSSWLSTDSAKDLIEVTSLLPNRTLSVNSLDVLGRFVGCGTDAEASYVTR